MREIAWNGRIGLAFESLVHQPSLGHLFTTRDREGGGNLSLSGGRDPEAARRERAFWSDRLGVDPDHWVVGGQVHGARVQVVDEEHRGRGARDPGQVIPDTDALVTTVRGLPLYIAVADCAAVLFHGPGDDPVLGCAHAGWRGIQAGVLARTVEALCRAGARRPDELVAGISPCIGLGHFEVGEEVSDIAPDRRRVKLQDRWHVDLAGWANDQLQEAGLRQSCLEVSGLDTAERADLFFSHRRDGEGAGRMGLIAVLRDQPASAGPPRG